MFLETTLLLKTMLILSAQLSVVLGGCFYFIRGANKAYKTDSTFLGMSFKGSMNMKRQLDLIPYFKAPLEYPMKMFKRIEEAYNPETKRLDSAYDDLKEAQNRVEVLQFLKDGYKYANGGDWIYSIFVLWALALFATVFFASTGINIYVGMALFTFQSIVFGPFLGLIMLEMDENDGYKALKIVFLVTLLTGFVGYSDIYSFSENNFLAVFLLFSLLGLIVFEFIRAIKGLSRKAVKAKAIFGAFIFSLFLLFDFNLIAKGEYMANNWDSAFELAFTIYLDIMNLLLEILDAMSD
jgi:FtsH-binding integral membrane protein